MLLRRLFVSPLSASYEILELDVKRTNQHRPGPILVASVRPPGRSSVSVEISEADISTAWIAARHGKFRLASF